jgi:hypothetical protein
MALQRRGDSFLSLVPPAADDLSHMHDAHAEATAWITSTPSLWQVCLRQVADAHSHAAVANEVGASADAHTAAIASQRSDALDV